MEGRGAGVGGFGQQGVIGRDIDMEGDFVDAGGVSVEIGLGGEEDRIGGSGGGPGEECCGESGEDQGRKPSTGHQLAPISINDILECDRITTRYTPILCECKPYLSEL